MKESTLLSRLGSFLGVKMGNFGPFSSATIVQNRFDDDVPSAITEREALKCKEGGEGSTSSDFTYLTGVDVMQSSCDT